MASEYEFTPPFSARVPLSTVAPEFPDQFQPVVPDVILDYPTIHRLCYNPIDIDSPTAFICGLMIATSESYTLIIFTDPCVPFL